MSLPKLSLDANAMAPVSASGAPFDTDESSPWFRFAIELSIDPTLGEVECLLGESLVGLAAEAVEADPAHESAPEVSVIVTAYECGPHLRASVKSLLRQSLTNIEIIIVDDCSKDDTYAVACEIATRYGQVRALRASSNGGTYVAKNLGLLHARGRFVTFQDSDDISHADRLRRQVEPLRRNPDLVATTCHYCRVDESSGQLLLNRGAKSRAGLISLMFDRDRVTRSMGFFDCVRVNADDEFKTRLKRVFGPRALLELDDCLYFALLRADGLTGSGHTANNLAGSNLKTFLAPVRQRYTQSFLEWHGSAPSDSRLMVEFPGLARPFPAPLSIDPMASRRSKTCTLLLLGAMQRQDLKDLSEADTALLRHINRVIVASSRSANSGDSKPTLEELQGLESTPPLPFVTLSQEASMDGLFKEAADLATGGILIIAASSDDLVHLSSTALRYALYLLYQQRAPSTAVVCQQGRVLFLHLDSLPVTSFRIPKGESSLMRGVLRQAAAFGVQIEFAQ